jgi:simple sugar transport system permease protein
MDGGGMDGAAWTGWLTQALSLAGATARLATPLVLAALGGLFAERAGVIAIGLEGKMLVGAFAAAAASAVTGSPWPGLAAALAAGVALALVHGLVSISRGGNQVVSGVAINILAAGLTVTLASAWFAAGGRTPLLPADARVPALFGVNLLVWLAALAVPAAAWVLGRSRFGLRLRAVGDNPAAVASAGLSVVALRYQALVVCGALAGLAGAYLSIAHGSGFVRDMTAGKGYLALAALIFGKWRPMPTLGACLLFAGADVVQMRLQGTVWPWLGEIPVQAIQVLPYALTVLLLAGWVGRAVAPRALGIPYISGR